MPSPSYSSSSNTVALSGNTTIDALLGGTKWGAGVAGWGVSLTYSFPWTTSNTAYFLGHGGSVDYSETMEHWATYNFGLDSTEQTAAKAALQAWANVADIKLSQVQDTQYSVGDIRIAWTSAGGDESWGWAYYPDSSGYYPSSGDIWISTSTLEDSTSWAAGEYNYQALMHEIGHALGLKHSFEDSPVLPASLDNRLYTIMSYTDPVKDTYPSAGDVNGSYGWISYYISPETPMVLDIAAIQYLYGANMNYKTGNDTYTFDPADPFFMTIWDAGGTDTISAANFSQPCEIDLRPGQYSSLRYAPPKDTGGVTVTYDGTDNLGIAYDCFIENAIGGSGKDVLTGNSLNNALTGGGGNDTLDGDTGIDTAIYSGASSAYKVSSKGSSLSVDNIVGNDGTDTLSNVERLYFSADKVSMALDEHGKEAMGIIGTLASGAMGNLALRGTIISLLDSGLSLTGLSQSLVDQHIVSALVGKSDAASLAAYVHQNVLGVPASSSMLNTLTSYINAHGQADFIATVAGLSLNVPEATGYLFTA